MNLLQFFKDFGTEDKCREHFRLLRQKDGIICRGCKGKEHYWLQGKWQWQCKGCSFRTTLKSGTIMEESKMSVNTWYQVMAFMSFSKKGISAKEMQRQLGHKRYETIWLLMHKVREAMGNRDNLYLLDGMVEMDEGFIAATEDKRTIKKLKAGKGSHKVTNTAVLAESTPLEDLETGQVSNSCRYFKMKALEDHKAAAVLNAVEEIVAETTILFTDKSTTYGGLTDLVEGHITFKSSKETTVESLRWVHIAISNARRTFNGIFHHMKKKYLQNYLDEFCYKLNRRYFGLRLFDRLAIAVAQKV